MVSEKQITDALCEVLDPEIGLNVVDLGLIYDIQVNEGFVKIRMTLTSPACPLGSLLVQKVREKVQSIAGVTQAEVELVFDPPWTPERLSSEAREKLGLKINE